ncbi:glycine receptor subunit alpha-1-like [Tubulanus polymorphus]|uniref:glycine receptor subunit alpha-1-like n=1 Tax=Tubulanus polymorphus TaxID=672921 RepID=UPI003DA46014
MAHPVHVKVNMKINTISHVDSSNMEYKMSIMLRQIWMDPRLSYTIYNNHITLDAEYRRKIWTPDTFFSNEKMSRRHMETEPNVLIRIYPNGTVYYSIRLTLTIKCAMDLKYFPLDTQHCFLFTESYAFTTADVTMQWYGLGIECEDTDLFLPSYKVARIRIGSCGASYLSGDYPCLVSELRFTRLYGYYLIQVYIPSGLVVVLAFLSFWIDVSAVPARVTLGITSVLTIITQTSSNRASLPHVSYVKAMDVWMSVCLAFAIGALVEFAIVNYYFRKDKEKLAQKATEAQNKAQMADDANGNAKNAETQFEMSESGNCTYNLDDKTRQKGTKPVPKFMKKFTRSDWIDFAARIGFLGSFLIFTIVYWVYYIIVSNDLDSSVRPDPFSNMTIVKNT